MESVQKWLLCLMAILSFPSHADESTGRQSWLDMQRDFAGLAGGDTGYYAIQDMREMRSGETLALLPAKVPGGVRWSAGKRANALLVVQYAERKAIIAGRGLAQADLLQLPDRVLRLPDGLIVRASFIHDTALKLWLYNPKLPAQRGFERLAFFDYDPRGVLHGAFHRYPTPVAVGYLDSRDEAGIMYAMGTLQVPIDGKSYELKTYSYSQSWDSIEALLILLTDQTSGRTTYGGGRVMQVDFPKGAPPDDMIIDLNRTYSFLCAHSNFYNCPLSLTQRIEAELPYGERYPPVIRHR